MSLGKNHFALLGVPTQFAVDPTALDTAYRALQSQVHPDRFAAASDVEKRVAMQWSTQANEAYQTLKDPVKRATYLLGLRGVDVAAENNTAMEPAFLMAQMEWRENVEDATAAKNLAALDMLQKQLRTDRAARLEKLQGWMNSHADQPAAEAVRQLMFLDKVNSEIREKIAFLDP
jgi:molecular chaperone HscB